MLATFLAGDASASIQTHLEQAYAFKGHTPDADDVANAIVYLAGLQAAAISGATLVVDAAMTTGNAGRLPDGAVTRRASANFDTGQPD